MSSNWGGDARANNPADPNALSRAPREMADDYVRPRNFPSLAAGEEQIQSTVFSNLREQHNMVATLRNRLRELRNKVGAKTDRGESPEPGKIDGIPVAGLVGLNNSILRECHEIFEQIDSCLGG